MSAVTVDPQAAPERAPAPLRRRRRKLTSYILPVFTGAMILYLTSPVLLMIMYGFNDLQGERQTAKFTCCTLNWWKNWLAQTDLNQSLKVSISVAIPAAIIATILGALIGLVLGRYSFSGRGGLNFVIFLAIAVPEIVLGSALLSMFVQANGQLHLGIHIGYPTILFSHIGFSIAFVAITVRARVQGLDRSLENAAQDLFATPLVAFFKVTLPLIFPGVVAGFLLAFVLSLDDFVITNFVQGQTNTFPTWVYGATRIGVPPQVNVWGTLLFGAGLGRRLDQLGEQHPQGSQAGRGHRWRGREGPRVPDPQSAVLGSSPRQDPEGRRVLAARENFHKVTRKCPRTCGNAVLAILTGPSGRRYTPARMAAPPQRDAAWSGMGMGWSVTATIIAGILV